MEHIVEAYPEADAIGCDGQLNTHKTGSQYDIFQPDKTNALLKKFELHFMSQHGSWHNVAGSESSVLSPQ